MRGGDFQSLICGEGVLFERVERVVMKNGPPLAFGQRVGRRTFAERFRDIPMRRYGRGGALILRANGASAEKECDGQTNGGFLETTNQCAAPEFAVGFAP